MSPKALSIPVVLLLAGLMQGCIGGSPEVCVPQDDGTETPMALLEVPDVYTDGNGIALVLQCTEQQNPLSSYTFDITTGPGRGIDVSPNGTFSDPLVFYAPTNGTEPGANITAEQENPGNPGDPTYRITFRDQNGNGLFDAEDEIHLNYDAGATTTEEFDSPLEGGRYEFWVKDTDGRTVEHVLVRVEGVHA